jgi:O-antigen/teichoic acid export membrane protein
MRLPRHYINTAIYLGVSVISKGASIFLIPLYTARLSRAEYAYYGLCQTLFWIVPAVTTLSLSAALGRFFFDYKDAEQRDPKVGGIALAIIGFALASAMISTLVFGVGHVSVVGLEARHLRLVMWICACMSISEIPMVYFRVSERALAYSLFNLGVFALSAGATVYLMVVRHLGIEGLLGGLLTAQVAGATFSVVFVLTKLRPVLNRQLLREATRYSIPFIPHMVGNSLMFGIDRWTLEYYGFRDDLGLYTLATQLTMPISLAVAAWNEASSPRFLAAWRDGGYPAAKAALPKITLGFILCGGAALLCILGGMPILRKLVGVRFQASFVLVPWIGISLVVGSLFSAFINVLFLRKTTRIIPVLTLSATVVNALLNIPLVPRFGVYGAILGTGLASAFRTGIMLAFAVRALKSTPSGEVGAAERPSAESTG